MDATALQCNICPKHPKFSDVSHLLTHVSSKAHLSHYFKLQVRSHQEPQAGILLDQYNQWYRVNNLAKLLSDRLSSKDSRKKKPHGKHIAHDKAGETERDIRYSKTTPLPTYTPCDPLPDYIDPRLSDPFSTVKSDTRNRENSFSLCYKAPAAALMLDHQTHENVGCSLATMVSPNDQKMRVIPGQWKRENEVDSEDERISSMHATPRWLRTVRANPNLEMQSPNDRFGYDPFVDDTDSYEYANNREMDKERADEIARLKGVLWPGMDIFDSATEQMRRKRNQKKDESILKMMERTSLCVEPTELVFSPTGVLRKQRVISGNVEDSSPLKGETPIPKKRLTRPKRVLSQADPNVQRGPERKRARKSARCSVNTFEDEVDQRNYRTSQVSFAQPPVRFGNNTSHADTEEFALSLGDQEFRSRNKLDVFRDTSNIHDTRIDDRERHLPGDSAPLSLLLRRDSAVHGGMSSPWPTSHSSNLFERRSHPFVDKENIEPLLNVCGRIDPLVSWRSPTTKRQPAPTDVGLPPQYFFADPHHLGLGRFESHDSPAGYSYNPLAASFSRASAEENPIYASESSYMFKIHSMACTNSPNATISDVGDDDFERLYLDGNACEV